jgi:hypothetical protein
MRTAATLFVVALLVTFGLWAISYPIYAFRRWLALRTKGYFVALTRRHPVVYQERVGAELMAIQVRCTPVDELGRYRVLIPSWAEWQTSAPEWAKQRRDEIFSRIIRGVPQGWTELPADWGS